MGTLRIDGLEDLTNADFQYCVDWINNYNTLSSTISFIRPKHIENYHNFVNKLENGKLIDMYLETDYANFKATFGWRNVKVEEFHMGVDRITIRTLFYKEEDEN